MLPGDVRREDLVEEFRQRLRDARARLARTVAGTDAELDTLEPHQAGALAEDTAADLATGVLAQLEGREKHDLDEIDAAQSRLEAGTFGVCEGCSGSIPLARLRAMPATRYCATCQARAER